MSEAVTVKVSSRHQISVPRIARERLNIRSGDRLLVDIQDGLLILVPRPQDYTAHLAGLHKDVWADVDTSAYLREEREAWDRSQDG
jgi:AbrB family looped-hinge helix DNA binding protein